MKVVKAEETLRLYITVQRHSYSTTSKMHLLSQIIFSCKTLYMFRMVFPPIIRSTKLPIQQWENVKQLLLPAAIGDDMEFRLIPDSSRQQQLFDIYRCCIHSFELLMMYGNTVQIEHFTRKNNLR